VEPVNGLVKGCPVVVGWRRAVAVLSCRVERLFEVGGGEVEVAGVAVAGQGDESGFMEESVVAQDVGAVDGGALAGMDGEGVPVVDTAGLKVVGGQGDRSSGPVGGDHDAGVAGVDGGDGGAVAVQDPEPVVVAAQEDPVAGLIVAVPEFL
jgi:hypothetical protein